MRLVLFALLSLGLGAVSLQAETIGGSGGPFIEYHTADLSSFDPALKGEPLVIGGMGLGWITNRFRLGGGGAAGMLWNGSGGASFGMGYGGVVGDYLLTRWLSARLLIGGGGYSVSKLLSETDTTQTMQKIGSGAFILFQPSLVTRFKVSRILELDASLGYFLPNEGRLHSLTIGVDLLAGKF